MTAMELMNYQLHCSTSSRDEAYDYCLGIGELLCLVLMDYCFMASVDSYLLDIFSGKLLGLGIGDSCES